MSTTIKLRATGALMFGGTQRVRGGILFADFSTAKELISSGRARLDDPADVVMLLDEPADRRDPMPRPLRWLTR